MLKRIAVWLVSCCLVGVCGAVCQGEHGPDSVVKATHSPAGRTASIQIIGENDLPDAPSEVLHQNQPEQAFTPGMGLEGSAPPSSRALVFETEPARREPTDFLTRLLTPSQTKQTARYHESSSNHMLGRATDAASSIFMTRDETGKRRLNTSYFVGVLTSVAVHSASRPYWARPTSASAPLGDFGSTIGNDAGMNLLHEFGPGLRQAVTGHLPTFVFKIEQRVIPRSLRDGATQPGR